MINVYYIITDSQKQLEEEYFLPSLKRNCPNFNPKSIVYKPVEQNVGNFRDNDYIDTLLFRNQMFIDLISVNKDDIIIMSDVDIIILKDFYDYVVETMKDKDIMHMRDGYFGVNFMNGGFTVIKCSEKTRNFYEIILDKTKNSGDKFYLDQDAIKDYYYKDNNPLNLKWDYLPASMFPVRYEWNSLKNHKNDVVLFHANVTMPMPNMSSVEQKKIHLTNFQLWYDNKIERAY